MSNNIVSQYPNFQMQFVRKLFTFFQLSYNKLIIQLENYLMIALPYYYNIANSNSNWLFQQNSILASKSILDLNVKVALVANIQRHDTSLNN